MKRHRREYVIFQHDLGQISKQLAEKYSKVFRKACRVRLDGRMLLAKTEEEIDAYERATT